MTRPSLPGTRVAATALCALAFTFAAGACDRPSLDLVADVDPPRAAPASTAASASPTAPTANAASAPTAADGFVPDGMWIDPFADHPAVENLEPALRAAIRQAAGDAKAAGVELYVTSGWRSHRYQQLLLDEAVATYGSEAEARRWVLPPDLSSHVTGEAVDVGPTDAASWLSQRGDDYGLCQIYANEMWHYELVIEPGGTCPRQRTDASER